MDYYGSLKQMKAFKWFSNRFIPKGARLEGPAWEISAPKDIPVFIRAIPGLIDDAYMYLETSSSPKNMIKVLKEISITPQLNVLRGIIWPKPMSYHVQASPKNIETVASLFEGHNAFEVCCHFHVYGNGKIVLEWHDAFFDDPFLVSKVVPEHKVKSFAREIGSSIIEASFSG